MKTVKPWKDKCEIISRMRNALKTLLVNACTFTPRYMLIIWSNSWSLVEKMTKHIHTVPFKIERRKCNTPQGFHTQLDFPTCEVQTHAIFGMCFVSVSQTWTANAWWFAVAHYYGCLCLLMIGLLHRHCHGCCLVFGFLILKILFPALFWNCVFLLPASFSLLWIVWLFSPHCLLLPVPPVSRLSLYFSGFFWIFLGKMVCVDPLLLVLCSCSIFASYGLHVSFEFWFSVVVFPLCFFSALSLLVLVCIQVQLLPCKFSQSEGSQGKSEAK